MDPQPHAERSLPGRALRALRETCMRWPRRPMLALSLLAGTIEYRHGPTRIDTSSSSVRVRPAGARTTTTTDTVHLLQVANSSLYRRYATETLQAQGRQHVIYVACLQSLSLSLSLSRKTRDFVFPPSPPLAGKPPPAGPGGLFFDADPIPPIFTGPLPLRRACAPALPPFLV